MSTDQTATTAATAEAPKKEFWKKQEGSNFEHADLLDILMGNFVTEEIKAKFKKAKEDMSAGLVATLPNKKGPVVSWDGGDGFQYGLNYYPDTMGASAWRRPKSAGSGSSERKFYRLVGVESGTKDQINKFIADHPEEYWNIDGVFPSTDGLPVWCISRKKAVT
jgi:hypothetical protein